VRYLQPYKARNKPADLTIRTNRRLFDDSASDAPTALAAASASCCSPLPIDTTISRQSKASSSSAFSYIHSLKKTGTNPSIKASSSAAASSCSIVSSTQANKPNLIGDHN